MIKNIDDFDKIYTPSTLGSSEMDNDGQQGMFETFGEDYWIVKDIDPMFVWTALDAVPTKEDDFDGIELHPGLIINDFSVTPIYYVVVNEERVEDCIYRVE